MYVQYEQLTQVKIKSATSSFKDHWENSSLSMKSGKIFNKIYFLYL